MLSHARRSSAVQSVGSVGSAVGREQLGDTQHSLHPSASMTTIEMEENLMMTFQEEGEHGRPGDLHSINFASSAVRNSTNSHLLLRR